MSKENDISEQVNFYLKNAEYKKLLKLLDKQKNLPLNMQHVRTLCVYETQGLKAARNDVTGILGQYPNYLPSIIFDLKLDMKEGNEDTALSKIYKALHFHHESDDLLNLLENLLGKKGRNEELIEKYGQLIKEDYSVKKVYRLGLVFHKLGQYDKALNIYLKVENKLGKLQVDCLLNIADCCFNLGNDEAAYKCLITANKVDESDHRAYDKLIHQFYKRGKYELVLDAYDRSLKHVKSRIENLFEVAHSYLMVGDKANSKSLLETILQNDARNVDAIYLLKIVKGQSVTEEEKELYAEALFDKYSITFDE